MRVAEREMAEIDKKHSSVGDAGISITNLSSSASTTIAKTTSRSLEKSISTNGQETDRLTELLRQIDEEARKLAATRMELQKLKKNAPQDISLYSANGTNDTTGGKQDSSKATTVPLPQDGPGSRSFAYKAVPEELVPDLCR
jgi:hypothetical protein